MRIDVPQVVVPRDLDLSDVRLPLVVVVGAANTRHAPAGWLKLNRPARGGTS